MVWSYVSSHWDTINRNVSSHWEMIWNMIHSANGTLSFVQMCCAANFPLGPWPKSLDFLRARSNFVSMDATSKMMSLTTDGLRVASNEPPGIKPSYNILKSYMRFWCFCGARRSLSLIDKASRLLLSRFIKFLSLVVLVWGFILLYCNGSCPYSWIILVPPILVSIGYYANWLSKPLYLFCWRC